MRDFGYKEGDFPHAERLSNEIVILPFYTSITEKEINYVRNADEDSLIYLRS